MQSIPEKSILLDRVEQLMNVDLKGKEMSDYQQQVIVLLIEIMRLTNGDKFTLGFLQGAVQHVQKNSPLIKKERTH